MADAPVPTIRQLATLTGVSRTTVSLALRNHPSLPADTRTRIQKIAAAHGYKQDPVVSSLMAQLRTSRAHRAVERIAYFTTWDTRDGWRRSGNENNYFLGACERAAKLGYEVEHIWAREPGVTTARLSKILYTRAIRGIVLAPFANPRSHITMDWKHFATAAISYTLVRPLVHRASHGHYNGMFLALRNLRHHGYRRIGFATRLEQSERVASSWLAALLVYQQSIPEAQRVPALLSPVSVHVGMDAVAFKKWYRQHKPDAVISNLSNPLDMLKAMGLRVPEDVGYASLDLLHKDTPWSGIDQQAAEVGAAAVDQVVTQLQNNEFGLPKYPKTVSLDGLWRDGNTLLPHRLAAAR
ncbi:MAG: LacI family DNA-binding transcriptional regulator [Opitutaceae bacterium]|jgi:LacI family transcriptional regulator